MITMKHGVGIAPTAALLALSAVGTTAPAFAKQEALVHCYGGPKITWKMRDQCAEVDRFGQHLALLGMVGGDHRVIRGKAPLLTRLMAHHRNSRIAAIGRKPTGNFRGKVINSPYLPPSRRPMLNSR